MFVRQAVGGIRFNPFWVRLPKRIAALHIHPFKIGLQVGTGALSREVPDLRTNVKQDRKPIYIYMCVLLECVKNLS